MPQPDGRGRRALNPVSPFTEGNRGRIDRWGGNDTEEHMLQTETKCVEPEIDYLLLEPDHPR